MPKTVAGSALDFELDTALPETEKSGESNTDYEGFSSSSTQSDVSDTEDLFAGGQDCSEDSSSSPQESPEESLKKLLDFMYAQPLHREILYRVLAFCQTRHMLTEVENFIMQLPEFAAATQSPFFIIEDLRIKGALACLELDENGQVVCEEDKIGLDENEIDDLVVDFAYENTELGNAALNQCSPQSRFLKLVGESAAYEQAYLEVMSFLTEKQGPGAIDAFLQQWKATSGSGSNVATSIVIENLEKSGVIRWQKGWEITEEGRDLLLGLEK